MPSTEARKVGLARALSKLGYCSRSRAADLIREGRVTLNGARRRDPETPAHVNRDRIAVDGELIRATRFVYLMMNKPRGLVTTASDDKGRETIYSLIAGDATLPWVAPIGRLDKASEGLLLLSNDSEWGAHITEPETHLPKTYHVQVNAVATNEVLSAVERGVKSEGEFLRATKCGILRSGEKKCWLEVTLDEGKNRHIRRMLACVNLDVLRLVRVSIGPLQLGTLGKGQYRSLSSREKSALDQAMNSHRYRSKH